MPSTLEMNGLQRTRKRFIINSFLLTTLKAGLDGSPFFTIAIFFLSRFQYFRA
jgi:hypothetical protein